MRLLFFKIIIELLKPKQKFDIEETTRERFLNALKKYSEESRWDENKFKRLVRNLDSVAIVYFYKSSVEKKSKRICAYVQANNKSEAMIIFTCSYDKYELTDLRRFEKTKYINYKKHYEDIFS